MRYGSNDCGVHIKSSLKNFPLKCLAFSILVLTLLSTLPCRAWEADVHQGLTEWLAIQAGFSPNNAWDIAFADQQQDESPERDAVQLVIHRILTSTRQDAIEASKAVQKFHFLSDASIPGPPNSRGVKPDNALARSRVHDANNLEALGEALHAYQDTWSHQGTPTIPIGFPQIREDLSWGHPEARGSWFRHRADLTPKNEDLPLEPHFRAAFASFRLQQQPNSDDPQRIARNFLETWILHPGDNKDLSRALEMVDLISLQKQLDNWNTSEHDPRQWASKFLTLWLLEDHGKVEELGHGYPGEPGYAQLPTDLAQVSSAGFKIQNFTALGQAIRTAGPGEADFDIADIDNSEVNLPSNLPTFGIAFRFLNLPYDALLVIMGKVKGENEETSWKVVRLLWAAI
jgi:hypothetical protein